MLDILSSVGYSGFGEEDKLKEYSCSDMRKWGPVLKYGNVNKEESLDLGGSLN